MIRAALAIALLTTSACSQEDLGNFVNGKRKAPGIVETVEGADGDLAFMKVYLDLTAGGMTLRVYNTPADAELFCAIDDREPMPCRHGDQFDRPVAGEHKLHVSARRNGKTVDSAITRFTISPGDHSDETIGSGDGVHPLALTVSSAGFVNGMAVRVSHPLTINFAFPQTPPCEKPVLRCALDSSSGIWSLCDARERRKVIPASMMALGAQTLYAQASCDDLAGPLLRVQWYGVPENYQPLMARAEDAGAGLRALALIRETDCASNIASSVTWECRVSGTAAASNPSWESCAAGGRIDSAAGNRYDAFRAVCGSQRGPAASF